MLGGADRPTDDIGWRWDFFVSRAGPDQHWARLVGEELKKAGYRVFLQDLDFVPGTNWPARVRDGMAQSARTIAIVSDDYLRSDFCAAEWQAAWKADPAGTDRKLIPIRVSDCDVPEPLGSVVSFDLFGLAEDAARTELRRGIEAALAGRRGLSTVPGCPPPDPGGGTRGAPSGRRRRPGLAVARVFAGLALLALEAGGLAAQASGREGWAGITAGVAAAGLATGVAVGCLFAAWRPPAGPALRWALIPGLLGAIVGAEAMALVGAADSPAAVAAEAGAAALLVALASRWRPRVPGIRPVPGVPPEPLEL